jgi:DNA repair exonuclease SbcCD ATPase subunit
MLECFKSKSGVSVYYYNGKRISKKEAKELGKNLPSCIVKSPKNEISSLKKRIKEIMYSGETVNKELSQKLDQERRDRLSIEKTLDNLTDQCSDRPDLLRTIEDLKDQVYKLETSNNEIKKDLEDTRQINREMNSSIGDLLESLEKYKEQVKVIDHMTKQIEYQDMEIQKYDVEIKELKKDLERELSRNGELQDLVDKLTIQNQDEKDKCKIANDSLERKVQAMAELSKTLKFSLEQEKERCLSDIQKTIYEEREISKKEAREYENKIADLNSKILVTEESLEELNKIGKIQTTSEIEGTKKKLSKVSKKLKKASK